jgi:hypothetical protein
MTKTEIKKARKAVRETREKWEGFDHFECDNPISVDGKDMFMNDCPMCDAYGCNRCITELVGDDLCHNTQLAVYRQHRIRPIWRALDRIDRYLDKMEAKLNDKT